MKRTVENTLTKCFVISGRVQGVFFRDSTKKFAISHHISGSAVNQSDGTVKVIAKGERSSLKHLYDWLLIGPELADVKLVEEVDINQHLKLNEFTTR